MESIKNCVNMCPSRPVRLSLAEAFEMVKVQVYYDDFKIKRTNYVDGLIRDICRIIAEMYTKKPESKVRINGEPTEAGIVQEVYRKLEHEHIEHISRNFRNQVNIIHKKMPYIQTALYNSYFELEARFENEGE
jgi:hypothetical protein